MPLRTAPDILGVRRDQLPKVWHEPNPAQVLPELLGRRRR